MSSRFEEKTFHMPSNAKNVPQSWTWQRLDKICLTIIDCPHSTPTINSDGPLMVRTQDILSGTFRAENAAHVSEATYQERIKRAEPTEGDLLYSREGTYFGIAAEVPSNVRVCLGQRMVLLRPDPTQIYFRFLRYWLNSSIITSHVYGLRNGSVAERLNLSTICGLPVLIPSLSEKRAIAHIIGPLDNKIELNRCMNDTLEDIAQTLFKSWFLDFDPVKAKVEGQKPEGIDDSNASLFPSHFSESVLGSIPEGWTVDDLGNLSSVAIGRTPPRKEPEWFTENPAYNKWISIRDLGMASVYSTRVSEYLTDEAISKFRIPLIKEGTVILSFKLTMGRVAITSEDMYSNEAIAQFNLDNSPLTPNYLYLHLRSYDYSILGSTSSIATAVNSQSLKTIKIIVPPPNILKAFECQVIPLMKKIKDNISITEMLKETRELLLPSFISGKLRVGEIKEIVEVVAL